jgi:hypothetical protein
MAEQTNIDASFVERSKKKGSYMISIEMDIKLTLYFTWKHIEYSRTRF